MLSPHAVSFSADMGSKSSPDVGVQRPESSLLVDSFGRETIDRVVSVVSAAVLTMETSGVAPLPLSMSINGGCCRHNRFFPVCSVY